MNTLVVYRAGERADATLAELGRAARATEGRLTVVVLAPQEEIGRGCCDTRSVMWNAVRRELAQEDLAQARVALDGARNGDLTLLEHPGRRERRRLRRSSPVPVVG